MNRTLPFVAAAILSLSAAILLADDPATPAADPAASQPATAPAASQPASAPAVVATVGKAEIRREVVDKILSNAPPGTPIEALLQARQRVVNGLIFLELMHAYLADSKYKYVEKDLADIKAELSAEAAKRNVPLEQFCKEFSITEERLRDQAKFKKLVEDAGSKDKTDAFIQAHPEFFNGTKVQASHILITCDAVAATAVQKDAVARLEKVAAEIQAGTISFEDAAKKHSACPSGQNGGDLGEFAFDAMVPAFAVPAFAMKVGDVSGIVRSEFGFHLIKVTKRTDGTEKPGPQASDQAKGALTWELQKGIFDQVLTTCPVTITP